MKLTKLAQTVILASAAFGASSAMAAACQVSDVTFSSTYPANQKNANACSNDLDGQGNTPNLAAMAALWGPGFVEGVTIEEAGDGSATGGTVLGGFKFTLSGVDETKSGTYKLEIDDTNGAAVPNLPYSLDFVLYLKGGSEDTGAYFFDDTLVDAEGGGIWTITFLNNSGKNIPDLSNISLWVREGEKLPPTEVPEPGSLALLGLGLAGLGLARRRSKA